MYDNNEYSNLIYWDYCIFSFSNEYNSYVLLLLLNQKLSKFLAVLAFLREKLTTQDCQDHQPELKKSK